MNVLDIYVARHCFGCDEAVRLAKEIGLSMPRLKVDVRNLEEMTESELPDIIATPSYFLNGHRIFLGNPRLDELVAKITSMSNE
jgi:alkyl hydroperoxide reductase subunit AhpF